MEYISLWLCQCFAQARFPLTATFSSPASLGSVSLLFWPINYTNSMVIKAGTGTFGSMNRCQLLLKNKFSILIKTVSRGKRERLQDFLIGSWTHFGFDKHSGLTGDGKAPKIIPDWKYQTGPNANWVLRLLHSSPDVGTLIYKSKESNSRNVLHTCAAVLKSSGSYHIPSLVNLVLNACLTTLKAAVIHACASFSHFTLEQPTSLAKTFWGLSSLWRLSCDCWTNIKSAVSHMIMWPII